VELEPAYNRDAFWTDDKLDMAWSDENMDIPWGAELFEFVPAVTETTGGEVYTTSVHEPNIFVDSGTVLGSWDMGSSSFSKAQTAKSNLSFSGKGRTVSIDIINKEDKPNTLLGVALVFKVKKP
jgi:hypothetical protein